MRFGKFAGYNLNPDWSSYFLNYRTLSQAIDRVKRQQVYEQQLHNSVKQYDTNKDIFFVLLEGEIQKVESFFLVELEKIARRLEVYENDVKVNGNLIEEQQQEATCFSKKGIMPLSSNELKDLFKDADTLLNYAQLNYIAAKKLLRRYDHLLNTSLQDRELEKIDETSFAQSITLKQLMSDIEVMYAELFTKGNTRTALKALRPSRLSYSSLFSGGFMFGIVSILFLMLLVVIFVYEPSKSASTLSQILPIYRALGIPLLFAWFWSILVLLFRRYTINYVYILQLDPKTIASYLDVVKISATFTIFWGISLLLYILSEKQMLPSSMANVESVIYPSALFGLYVVFLFMPFNIFYRATRFGLLYSFLQILISPIGRLYFRDFFLADILTSLPDTLIDFGYTICFFITGQWQHPGYLGECGNIRKLYLGSIIAFLPFWFRFMQCLKKYYQTKKWFPHIVNAGKYFSGLVASAIISANTLWYYDFNPAQPWNSIYWSWVIAKGINAIYSWIWDITMDWGLWRKGSKNKFLRNELILSNHWVYFAIMGIDLVLRMVWVAGLVSYMFIPSQYWSIVTGILEVCRRSMWAFFRVELEALENWEEYRTIYIPIPTLGRGGAKKKKGRSLIYQNESSSESSNDAKEGTTELSEYASNQYAVLPKENRRSLDTDYAEISSSNYSDNTFSLKNLDEIHRRKRSNSFSEIRRNPSSSPDLIEEAEKFKRERKSRRTSLIIEPKNKQLDV
eukprot:TRINITY_DN4646_c0_g1_i1.p1 TRINITY_DN4646_c0_g1~~TRINITY_DN4646_c0_g1_i1.p1  ORF type:complete len:738 (+),score=71.60 TRINITY_DN4646_c0_g1_i1:42-2255(+)